MTQRLRLFLGFALFSCITQASPLPHPKNIILMIVDGMGPSYTSAYRYYQDNQTTFDIENTIFDQTFTGTAQTRPHPQSGYITDSAAAASALATGHKVISQALSMNEKNQPIKSLFEYAKEKNKLTGVVVTSPIYHATPAAFLTHHPLNMFAT